MDGSLWKMALELRTELREIVSAEKVLMFMSLCPDNVWNASLARLRRVHPLSWRTVMAVLEILT